FWHSADRRLTQLLSLLRHTQLSPCAARQSAFAVHSVVEYDPACTTSPQPNMVIADATEAAPRLHTRCQVLSFMASLLAEPPHTTIGHVLLEAVNQECRPNGRAS